MFSCNVTGIISRTSGSLSNEAPHVRDGPSASKSLETPLGKGHARRNRRGRSRQRVRRQGAMDRGYGTGLRGRHCCRPKNRGDGATRPRRGRYIVCRNHQWAEKDGADRAQGPSLCQREAVESTHRQICARSLARFDRGRALAQACKGDKALVGNAGFRRCLKTVGGERFALIPTRSCRRGSSTASLCCTQHRPQPLEVMLCCKTIVDGRAGLSHRRQASVLHAADFPQESACCWRRPRSERCSRRRPSYARPYSSRAGIAL